MGIAGRNEHSYVVILSLDCWEPCFVYSELKKEIPNECSCSRFSVLLSVDK